MKHLVSIAVALLTCLRPAWAGDVMIVNGIQCKPYSHKGVTYYGCPGEAPPPADSAYAAAQAKGDTRTAAQFAADCAGGRANASCSPPPTPHGCPPWRKWDLSTGIARCVDDPAKAPQCPSGLTLSFDAQGTPVCAG